MTNIQNLKSVFSGFIVKLSIGVVALSFVFVSFYSLANASTLNRELSLGMSGLDVSALQSFLAKDATLYPQGKVTGYFGFLTKSAVSNFQNRNGIATVGRVGPVTLVALNSQMDNVVTTGTVPVISNNNVYVANNNATVNWNTNDYSKGVVYYSTSPLSTYERENSVDVSGSTMMTDTNFHNTQSVFLNNLQSNTTYYYLIYATNQAGNVSVTWPSTFRTN